MGGNSKCIQVMTSMLPEERDAFDAAAAAAGTNRSAWLCELGRRALADEVRRSLPDRPPAHRPRKSED